MLRYSTLTAIQQTETLLVLAFLVEKAKQQTNIYTYYMRPVTLNIYIQSVIV